MQTYRYIATDSAGLQQRGKVSAKNRRELYTRLQAQGLHLSSSRRILWNRKPGALPSKVLIQFFVQLSLLERTSLQLLDSLRQTRKATGSSKLRDILDNIIHSISEGMPLTEAFRQFPETFNQVILARLQAGESSGNLQETFQDITEYLKWREELKSKTKKALLYPTMLILVILVLVGAMMTFMVPQLTGFLENMDIETSIFTSSLIVTSNVVKSVFPFLIPSIAILFILVKLLASLFPSIALKQDYYKYKTPLLGPIRTRIEQWNFSRLMGMTLQYNKRIQDNISLAIFVAQNRYFKHRLKQARLQLLDGSPVTESLTKNELLDDMALRLLEAGEVSGDLSTAFEEIVDYYSIMVNESLDKITNVIKPAALVFAAVMLIWVIAGTMLPLYGSLSSTRF